ncbi:GIY-YIG nuclease family protein [Hoyosella subflava]|uniref:GIY-YIG nuclease family protein n=1 Tax=Hoyosella subflava TaxID=639313 RepID=UPI0003090664|nr:GIY-YIG nuclease family protein [Hoyosella subflava]
MQRERDRLEKEKQHYLNTLRALEARGDESAATALRAKLADVERAITDVGYRKANLRAGYVYVISNLGSFGERMFKIGLTRRLEPIERVRELSYASVPFNFDVHAPFFAEGAVEIEAMLHREFAHKRVNRVNNRREFFYVTPKKS